MAALLRDGADLDSMDRSLLDCELRNERLSRADIVSLDPTRLSLSCEGSLSPPSPASRGSHVLQLNTGTRSMKGNIPKCLERREKKETIVKFGSSSSTMVVRSDRREVCQSAGREGEIRSRGGYSSLLGEGGSKGKKRIFVKNTGLQELG